MKTKRLVGVMAGLLVVAWCAEAGAAEGKRPVHLQNRIHVELDDNVYRSDGNEEESFRITDSLVLSVDKELEAGFLGLRLGTAYTWWDDRPSDDNDWRHVVDFIFNQDLSRRLSLGLLESFVYVERPELESDDGLLNRPDSSYYYNTLNASLEGMVSKTARLTGSARYQLIRYDDDDLADRDDYDIYSAGLTYATLLGKEASVFVDGRFEQTTYTGEGEATSGALPGTDGVVADEVPDRGATSYALGVGGEQMFSPNLMGRLRVGYTMKDLEAANQDDESAPYAEASLTVLPSPQTSLTLGAAYSLYQSSLLTFANQQRTTASVNLGHDVTAKVKLNVGASYVHSDYEAQDSVDAVDEALVEDGSEDAVTMRARVSYRLNRTNSLEAGWRYTDFSSDYRADYGRNLYDIAWRVNL